MVSIKVHDRLKEQPHSLTLALDGGTGPASYPGHFTIGETALQPFKQETGWAPEPFWRFQRRGSLLPLLEIKL